MLLDHAGFDRKARIVTILDEMMGGLEISPSQRELAQQRYEAAGRWLASSGVPMLRDLYIYLQGSTALGTTVKPIGHNEHDVDLVAHRPSYEPVEPAILKKAIGDRLRENGHYAPLLEEMPRCWRLVYANEFHMDITPAIPNARCSNGGELVPDRTLRCWKASNPKGYKREFERRAALKPQFRLNKSLQFDAKRADANVEPYPVAMGTMDVLDTEADRRLQNSLATFSNIPGGRERERSLFRAAERCEREPKINDLTASTGDTGYWFELAHRKGAPAWVRKASAILATERLKVDERAGKTGKKPRHAQVTIAKVSAEEAYERLSWFEAQPGASEHKLKFKQGRAGITQTRFVAELPHGIGPRDRAEILQRFCKSLADEGWMLVGAIHQPDPHGDRRNFHIHVDGCERPARWMELPEGDPNDRNGEGGCWDFEYVVRKRGKDTFPYRANKIAAVGRSPDGKRKSDAQFIKVIRRRYVAIVNEVVGGRPGVPVYFAGTYKEAGLNRSPLAHLGNATIAKEKQGIETPRGSENARKIYVDALEDCHARKASGDAALAKVLKDLTAAAGQNRHIHALIDYYAAISKNALERTLQHELVDVVERMAKSRASAVIEHGVDPAGLAQAQARLREIDSVAPAPGECKKELDRTVALRAEAASVFDDITSLLPGLTAQAIAERRPILPPPVTLPAKPGRYAELECGRLRQWLAKWAEDPARLIFTDTGISLGPDVQQSVRTLFRHYARDAGVQKLLTAERKRRIAAGVPLGMAPPAPAPAPARRPMPTAPTKVSAPMRDSGHGSDMPTRPMPTGGLLGQAAQMKADDAASPDEKGRALPKGPRTGALPLVDPTGKGQGR